MELRHLRYFTALARTLHFAKAAQQLHIVQPALTMQIKALEEELGVSLFKRSKRSVELTQAGHLFLEEADRALKHAARAADLAKQASYGIRGTLRIGFSAGAVYSVVQMKIVYVFRAQYPQIVIEPAQSNPRDQIQKFM